MAHITATQKEEITRLRADGVSFVKISQQTGIPMGTCKTLFYKDRPPAPPPTRTKTGQLKSRSSKGRKPENGKAAQSDKARAAACRARRKAHLDSLVSDLPGATDLELSALLATAIRSGDTSMVQAIVIELHTRHCCNSVTVTNSIPGAQHVGF